MEPVAKRIPTIERPAQRLWRWIVVVLVLCVGAYLGWRTQNFADPRYVGRWNIVQDHGGRLKTEIEFFADGTGAMYEVIESQPKSVMDFRWGVEDELLLIDNDPNAAKARFYLRVMRMIGQWISGPQQHWTRDYLVTAVEPNRLMLLGVNAGADNEHFEIVKVVE